MKKLLFLAGISLLLTGCSSAGQTPRPDAAVPEGAVQIGRSISADPLKDFTLSDQKDVLAADGLYYATWVTGDSVPYENSDGDTVDLYDAQLYFLAAESSKESKAQENYNAWLAAAKEHYEVLTEESAVCGEQTYTVITYNCISEDSPYDRGVSAFAVCGVNAVCAELTCVEEYKEDLTALLTTFLNGCHYEQEVS